jgi:hypothetical protein
LDTQQYPIVKINAQTPASVLGSGEDSCGAFVSGSSSTVATATCISGRPGYHDIQPVQWLIVLFFKGLISRL